MKTIYTICGLSAIVFGIMYWCGILEPDAVTLGCYAVGFGCMACGEALRK